jgi:hypothetical protein
MVPFSERIQTHNLYVSDVVSYPDPEPDLIRIQLVLWIQTGHPDLDQEGRNDSQKELCEILWFEELSGLTGGLSFIGGWN